MDEEHMNTSPPAGDRRRLKIAGIAVATLLAVPGGAVISNAFASDGGGSSTAGQAESTGAPVQYGAPSAPDGEAAPNRGDRGEGGDRGDCPPKAGDGNGSGNGSSGESSAPSAEQTLQ